MKYIRTKNGIWLFGGTHANGKVIIGKKQEPDFGYCFAKKDIIKQADTIEELCDEFDAINVGLFSDRKKTYKSVKEAEKDRTFLYDKLRGVIYTDKGRIYVAEKFGSREWELL